MPKITAIIVSFMRPQYTIDCIRTLHERFPKIKILVGENYREEEDVRKEVERAGGKYFIYPYDSGNSFVRNRLVEKVKTKYVLVGDDDFWYDENTKVYEMAKFLEKTDFDLIGGAARYPWVENQKGHRFMIEECNEGILFKNAELDDLELEPKSGLRFIKCDSVAQFFVAKTKSMIKWDERMKAVYEHPKFFIDFKRTGKKVAYTPDSIVWHKKQGNLNSEEYKSMRWRKGDLDAFLKALDIKYLEMRGKRYDRKSDVPRIKAYYAIRTTKIKGRIYNRGDRVYAREPHRDLREKSIPIRKWLRK